MKMFRKLVSLVAAATVLTSSMAFTFSANAAQLDDSAAVASQPNIQEKAEDGVILHAFNWSYNSIKENLPQIAAAGYSTVQTSPATQPKNYGLSADVANQWWKLYQPVSMSIAQSSWLGTRTELADLCAEADNYGIKIIVDIVANHMANNVSASGTDLPNELGPEVKTYEPQIYNSYSTYFHPDKGTAGDGSVENQVQGHVSACPDLKTENSYIQGRIYDLLKDLIDCGVDGFRFDAAKHIETEDDGSYGSQFWVNTLDKAKTYYKNKTGKDLFAYGEILNGLAPGRKMSSYTKRMRVTDNTSGNAVLQGVKNGNASSAAHFGYDLSGSGSNSVLWAESHDTFMGTTGGSTSGISDDKVVKAWAIVASRKDATALYFARPGSSLMGEAAGDLTYKSTVVSEINKFHNAFVGQSEKTGVSGAYVYVARGNSGIVITNVSGNNATVSISGTGLADGSYVDTVTGNAFTVSGGTVSGQIGSTGVAVVYNSSSTPKAIASVESGSFTTDTMTVKLSLENAVSGTYALENSAPVSFTGSTTIRIGSDYKVGEKITLNLTATDANGNTAPSTYFYTKKQPTTSGVFVFLNPKIANGWTNVSCYVYDENTTNKTITYSNGGWPGQAMTYDSSLGYYYIEIPAACVETVNATGVTSESTFDLPHSPNTYVIFNGTKNNVTTQYPAANAIEALKCKLGGGTSNMVLDAAKANGWKATTMTPTQVVVEATDVTKGSEQPVTDEPTTEPPTTEEPTTEEPTTEPIETQYVVKGKYGDANRDGVVNIRDVTLIQRTLAEIEPPLTGVAKELADVDGNGTVSLQDATMIQRYLAEFTSHTGKTGQEYGEYEPDDPSGETFILTAESNFFPKKTVKVSKDTKTATVSYVMNSEKSLLDVNWKLSYDNTVLKPVASNNYMPAVSGAQCNTKTSYIVGNATILTLVPMQTADGKPVTLVTATFDVLKPENTTVELNIIDLTLSKLNPGETKSKQANETTVVLNGEKQQPDSKYSVITSAYDGAFDDDHDYSKDPVEEFDPSQPVTTPTQPTEPTTPTTPTVPTEPTMPSFPLDTKMIEFTNNKGWDDVYIYVYGPDGELSAWPGFGMNVKGDNGYGSVNYWYEVPLDTDFIIFNNGLEGEDAQQTVNVDFNASVTGWYPIDEQDELGHWLVDYWIDGEIHTDPVGGTRTIEFTDNQGWGCAYIYTFGDSGETCGEFPGTAMTEKGDNGYGQMNYTFEVPTDTSIIVFSNGKQSIEDGLDQTVDVYYDNTTTGWYPLGTRDAAGHLEVGSWSEGGSSSTDGFYLVGYFDGVDYWGTDYPFVNGQVTMNFSGASYAFIRDEAGNAWMTNGWAGESATSATLYSTSIIGEKSNKLIAPAGQVTFTLTANGDDTFTLSTGGGGYNPPTETKKIEFTNTNNWPDVYIYIYCPDGEQAAWPGSMMQNPHDNGYNGKNYDFDVPTNAEFIIFSNGHGDDDGGQQTVDIPFDASIDGWYLDGGTDEAGHYYVKHWPDGGSGGSKTVLFTDGCNWGKVYCYAWDDNDYKQLGEWPGTQMTESGWDDYGHRQYSVNVPDGAKYLIFTNNEGQQTVNIDFDRTKTGWYTTGSGADNAREVASW